MKILFASRKPKIPFEKLEVRDTFLYHDVLYMKIKTNKYYSFNAIVLDDGEENCVLKICEDNAMVTPVHSELICKS